MTEPTDHPNGGARLDLAIEHDAGDERAVVCVGGEIDVASVGELEAALDRVLADGATDVCLDLDAVAFMDSTGLTALISARTKLEGRGRVRIERASSSVRRTIEVAGLTAFFQA